MPLNSHHLERALPAIVGTISDRCGVEVKRGSKACTDGKTIWIPRLPELVVSQSEFTKTIGFVYHETFHVMYDDFDCQCESAIQQAVFNILCDIRIELIGQSRHPAAKRCLARLVEELVRSDALPAASAATEPQKLIQMYMSYKLRADLLLQDALSDLSQGAEALLDSVLSTGLRVRLEALMFEVANCRSTRDCLALAQRICSMLQDAEQQDQGQQQGQSQQQDQGQSCPSALSRVNNMQMAECEPGLGDILATQLDRAAVDHSGSGFVAMPNDLPLKLPTGPQRTLEGVRAAGNALRFKTLQWLSSATESEVSLSRAGVAVDVTRLHLARRGAPIFRKVEDEVDVSAAVSIVLDRSGSMSSLLDGAVRATATAMVAYDTPGVVTQLTVFPSIGKDGEVGVSVLKDWDQTSRALLGDLAQLQACGTTPLAEALLFAATGLVRREEGVKILLVLTDGEPDSLPATIDVITRARASGICCLGIGIGVDPVGVFGAGFAAKIDSVGQLASAIASMVRSSLKT